MNLSDKELERILECYTPEYRFLRSIKTNYPKAEAVFNINKSWYLTVDLNHFTVIENYFCLNQFGLSAILGWLKEKKIPGLKISPERYLEIFEHNTFINESSVRFKRIVDPDAPVKGYLEAIKTRRIKNLHIGYLDYSFNEGLVYGKALFSLKIPQ